MVNLKKSILVVGGSSPIIPFIKRCQEIGYEVVCCDKNVNPPCKNYANYYYPVDATDNLKVLEIAKKYNVSAASTYAADPLSPTAAFVSEKLDLIGNPYESVRLLTQKHKFRSFLKSNGFKVPFFQVHNSLNEAFEALSDFKSDCFIKPVDSSGSKGVSKISPTELDFPTFEKYWLQLVDASVI